MAHDLVAHVDTVYRTLAERSHRGIAGLSMGGTGALTLAFTYPDLFAATASLSGVAAPFYLGPHPYLAPAAQARSLEDFERGRGAGLTALTRLRWGADTASWWRDDPERGARHLVQSGQAIPAIRLDIGRDDPYIDQNRALDAALTTLAVRHQYIERAGRHQWAYWRANVAETLVWLAGYIASTPPRGQIRRPPPVGRARAPARNPRSGPSGR